MPLPTLMLHEFKNVFDQWLLHVAGALFDDRGNRVYLPGVSVEECPTVWAVTWP